MAGSEQINEALFSAAKENDLAGVKKALNSGAQINYVGRCLFDKDKYNKTALGLSAFHGHFQIVQYLCEAGANPFLPYGSSWPNDWAYYNQHADIENYLEQIMKLPERINKIDEKTGFTPLTYYIKKKVDRVIKFGPDVCKIDRHGKTPLIYAIERGSMGSVKILLEKGAIASGVSAVKCALELGKTDIVRVLIDTKGLIINGYFDDGYTLLTKSLATNNMDIAKCLLEKGANEPKTIGKGPFQKLAVDGNFAAYEFLIANGWDVNQVDENGKNALALNASNQNLLVARLLIENGAKIGLAKPEVDSFRKANMDFDCFLQEACKDYKMNNDDVNLRQEKWNLGQTGQEECCHE